MKNKTVLIRFGRLYLVGITCLLLTSPSADAQVNCPANYGQYARSYTTLSCYCSPQAANSGSVWGTGVYTSDSRICRAARHFGAVSRNGGYVMVQGVPGQQSYPASRYNGVTTSSWGSYGWSFRVAPARTGGGGFTGVGNAGRGNTGGSNTGIIPGRGNTGSSNTGIIPGQAATRASGGWQLQPYCNCQTRKRCWVRQSGGRREVGQCRFDCPNGCKNPG